MTTLRPVNETRRCERASTRTGTRSSDLRLAGFTLSSTGTNGGTLLSKSTCKAGTPLWVEELVPRTRESEVPQSASAGRNQGEESRTEARHALVTRLCPATHLDSTDTTPPAASTSCTLAVSSSARSNRLAQPGHRGQRALRRPADVLQLVGHRSWQPSKPISASTGVGSRNRVQAKRLLLRLVVGAVAADTRVLHKVHLDRLGVGGALDNCPRPFYRYMGKDERRTGGTHD